MRNSSQLTSRFIGAELERGRIVVKASAAQEHLPLLHAINEGKLPKFAGGGPVSEPITLLSDVKTSAGQGGGGAPHVHINAPVTVNASGGTPAQNADLAKQMGAQFEAIARGVTVEELRVQMRPGNILNR